MSSNMEMQQQWMSYVGPRTSCSIIHPDSSCMFQIFNKCRQVVGVSAKLYAVLYLTMFLIRFRKIYGERKIKKTIRSWTKQYIWSLVFMSWTVGGMKLALCFLNKINFPISGKVCPVLAGMASPSIFCLDKAKRYEVSMFAFVRACRSIYIFLKKRFHFKCSTEKEICFIMIYGLLSYFYFQRPETLRNREILVNLWGQF